MLEISHKNNIDTRTLQMMIQPNQCVYNNTVTIIALIATCPSTNQTRPNKCMHLIRINTKNIGKYWKLVDSNQ